MANKNRKRTFFDKDTEHGLVKRIMLKKYLQAYIAKTQNEQFNLRTLITDGFAGAGRYGKEWPDEIERYGSPLIALMIALGDCYRKDMEKQKKETEKQARSGEGETRESEMQGRPFDRTKLEHLGERETNVMPEKGGMHGPPEEVETNKMSEENRMQEKSGTHGILERNGMFEGPGECETQDISKENGQQRRAKENKTKGRSEESEEESRSGLSKIQDCHTPGRRSEGNGNVSKEVVETLDCTPEGATFQESKNMKSGEDTKNSLWGWPASEMDPEAELAFELEQFNRRHLKDTNEETPIEIENCVEPAKISLMFIENNMNTFKKLAANVELVIIKFLKRCYPSYKYVFRLTKGKVLLYLNTGPFSISVKVIKGKFVDIQPPPMLNDRLVRSLTFLDPFGITQTPMSHIAKFAPGPGNEVFINFMSSYVNRFVSKCTEGVVELYGMSRYKDVAKLYGIDPPDLENDDNLVEFVKYVIHFCQPEMEHLFSNKINKCTSNYEDFLKRKTNSKYSLTFEVKDKGNTTIFHMIHITNHIRGVEAMKESMNRCSQRQGEMIMSEYDIVRKGQKLNLGNLDDPIKVAEVILNRFRGEERVPMDRIRNYVLFDTKYLFRKTPLKILQMTGMITDVVNMKGNLPNKNYEFPDKDNKKEPIVWLISFDDDEYNTDIANRLQDAEAENQRQMQERNENARKKKEQKLKEALLKKEKRREKLTLRENRRKEIEEKKKKMEEERLVKKRKKEERRRRIEENKKKRDEAKLEKQRINDEKEKKKEARRRQTEENKRKRDEAKLEKQKKNDEKEKKKEERRRQTEENKKKRDDAKLEKRKRKEEQMITEMRSQKKITNFFRQLAGETQSSNAGNLSRDCSEIEPLAVDNAPETDKNNEPNGRRDTESEESSGSGMGKEQNILQEKENKRKTEVQKRANVADNSTDREKTKSRKRKLPETPSNKNTPEKRRAGTSGIDDSTPDNVFGTNEES